MRKINSELRGSLFYRKPMLSSVALTMALPMLAVPAFAQEPPTSEVAQPSAEARRDVVVVTATRRETTVLEVPYNISVVSSEGLENAAVEDFSDLSRLVPGISYVDTGSRNAGNASSFILRGVNADATSANADYATQRAATVSTYLNETPLFFEMNLKDIERVEVLRGPQGTLYGSGAVGGTVKVITKSPELGVFDLEAGGEAYSTKDGDWSYGLNGVVNVPLGEKMAFRAAANYDDIGGFIDAPNLYARDANGAAIPEDPANPITSDPLRAPKSNYNTSNSLAVRGALLFQPSDAVRATLTHHYQVDEGVGRQAIHPTLGDDDDLFVAIEEPFERTVNVTSLEAEVDFGFATLTSASSFYKIETEVEGDYTDRVSRLYAPVYYYNTYPRLIGLEDDRFDDEVLTQEFRLSSPGGDFIDWIGGVFYQKIKHRTLTNSLLPGVVEFNALPGQTSATQLLNVNTGLPLDTDVTYAGDIRWENEELAAFGEVTLNFTDAWQVTAGARVFNTKFDVATDAAFLGEPHDTSGSSDESDSIFKLNTSYQLTLEHSVYATWAQGFRRGGANALAPFDPPEYESYQPDTADNYEVGLKGMLANGDILYTAAAFRIDWDNVQVNSFTPFATGVIVNGNSARNTGFELEAFGSLADELQFSAGYTYTDAKLAEAFALPGLAAAEGTRLPGVPRHMASVSLDYETPLSFWQDTSFGFHVGGSYRSATKSSFEEAFPIDAFSIWNVSASLNRDKGKWTLFVDNVFDEIGITGGIGDAIGPIGQYKYRARPRTIGVRFTINWGD